MEAVHWSSPQQIVLGANLFDAQVAIDDAQVAIDNDGHIVIVWEETSGNCNSSIFSVILTIDSKGALSNEEPTLISKANTTAANLQLSMNGNGKAVIVWLGENGIVQTSTLKTSDLGTGWSPAKALSKTAAVAPQVQVDETGNTLVIWMEEEDKFFPKVVKGVSQIGDSTDWSSIVTISGPGEFSLFPPAQIAVSQGKGKAVWTAINKDKTITIQGAQGNINSENSFAWDEPVTLSKTSGKSYGPQLAIGPNGRYVTIWRFFEENSDYSSPSIQYISSPTSEIETLATNVTERGYQYVAVAATPGESKSELAFAYWSTGNEVQFSESSSQGTAWTSVGAFTPPLYDYFLDATIFEGIPQVIWLQDNLVKRAVQIGSLNFQTDPPSLLASTLSAEDANVVDNQIPMIASNDKKGIIVAIWVENTFFDDGSKGLKLVASIGQKSSETSKMLMYWGLDEAFQSDLP